MQNIKIIIPFFQHLIVILSVLIILYPILRTLFYAKITLLIKAVNLNLAIKISDPFVCT
jgi:hypothetical protein